MINYRKISQNESETRYIELLENRRTLECSTETGKERRAGGKGRRGEEIGCCDLILFPVNF